MVHGDDAVEVLALQKDGVAGKRSLGVDAFGLCGENCRADGVDFLTSECAILAVVGVEGADAEARILDAGFPAIAAKSAVEGDPCGMPGLP